MKKRIIYYDILKVISLCAVILMHIVGNTINTFNLNGTAKIIYNIISNLCYFAVPIFVMISGGLFLNPDKSIDIKTMFKKYILRIIICLFLFGMFYSILEIYFNTRVVNINIILDSLKNILTGSLWAHMWYLYLILSLYLLTPIFRIISSKCTKAEYKYLLIVLFVFTILLNDISAYFKINIAFNILIFNPYIFLYFLGDYLSRYQISKNIEYINYITTFIAIVIIILNNIFNLFDFKYLTYTCLISFTITLSLFTLIKNIKFKLNKKLEKIIINISECLLGIYLIHQLIINIIYKLLKLDIILNSPYVCLILYSLLVFVISYIITYFLKRIKFVKKYIL